MQYIKGKLANLEDLLILIDILKEKKVLCPKIR